MRRQYQGVAMLGVAAVVAGSVAVATTTTATASTSTSASTSPTKIVSRTTKLLSSCAAPKAHHASCLALVRARRVHLANGTTRAAAAATTPTGYGPADLASAYQLPTAKGSGQTVGIVDAFNDPTAAADLATYRSYYGLPACTVASGCFKQVGETGTTALPSTDTGWAQEESLDLDMVSAVCPNCHILLVEATSASDADLGASVDEAVKLGATEVSNSYGGSEASSETSENADYTHPGVAITASAGDSGYGVEFPAAAPSVTAVGGTSLTKASNARGWTETVWGTSSGGGLLGAVGAGEGTGSGCSAYEAKPAWQKDTGCTKRTVADVSAVADPSTGVAVYDSTADSSGDVGWQEFGGTSVASPIIASVYGLAGGVSSSVTGAQLAYAHPSALNDVTSGTNGSCTGILGRTAAKAYLCTGEVGYDGPTGLGTPIGIGAF